jgi:hypothetical protein
VLPRTPGEGLGEEGTQYRPAGAVHLRREFPVAETEHVQQGAVELRFERPDGDIATVGASVDVVEGGATVEQVGARPVGPLPLGAE